MLRRFLPKGGGGGGLICIIPSPRCVDLLCRASRLRPSRIPPRNSPRDAHLHRASYERAASGLRMYIRKQRQLANVHRGSECGAGNDVYASWRARSKTLTGR